MTRRFIVAVGRHPVRGAAGVVLIVAGIVLIATVLVTPTYLSALLHR